MPVWTSKFLVDSMWLGSVANVGVISFRICVSVWFTMMVLFHVYNVIMCIAYLGVVAQSKLMWFKMVLIMYYRCEPSGLVFLAALIGLRNLVEVTVYSASDHGYCEVDRFGWGYVSRVGVHGFMVLSVSVLMSIGIFIGNV